MAEQNSNPETGDFVHVSPGEIRNAISVLEQALFNHVHWTNALNTTLICGLHPDERDLEPEATPEVPVWPMVLQRRYAGGSEQSELPGA